jgi:hypothetical protein
MPAVGRPIEAIDVIDAGLHQAAVGIDTTKILSAGVDKRQVKPVPDAVGAGKHVSRGGKDRRKYAFFLGDLPVGFAGKQTELPFFGRQRVDINVEGLVAAVLRGDHGLRRFSACKRNESGRVMDRVKPAHALFDLDFVVLLDRVEEVIRIEAFIAEGIVLFAV